MKKRSFPVANIYQLLEPGPVVMVTSAYGKQVNVMTMAWFTMVEFEPPLIACIISEQDYSFELIKKK